MTYRREHPKVIYKLYNISYIMHLVRGEWLKYLHVLLPLLLGCHKQMAVIQ